MVKKILYKIIKTNPDFYKKINKYGNNIAHNIITYRYNRNKQMNYIETKINIMPDIEILKLCDNECWNQPNINNITPLDLLVNLDYKIYSSIIITNKISISRNIIERLNKSNFKNEMKYNNWIELYKKLPKYILEDDNIIMDNSNYIHSTLFRSTFQDLGIYIIYLNDTFNNLYIPNMNYNLLNNLTFDDTFTFQADIIKKEPIFPWTISYFSENEYYIHPYLNNLINSTRRNNNKDIAIVFLCINYEDIIFHANILIYDFKKMTIERFEPYGNTNNILVDDMIDNIMEEELTWNTGFSYKRPKDYLPYIGFQNISDENNKDNIKPGDFGGFCLAWCLWYLECKLKNLNVDSKILVDKLIKKMLNSELKFSEYIRNYSEKINNEKNKYLKEIGVNDKEMSNSNFYIPDNILINYLVGKLNT